MKIDAVILIMSYACQIDEINMAIHSQGTTKTVQRQLTVQPLKQTLWRDTHSTWKKIFHILSKEKQYIVYKFNR